MTVSPVQARQKPMRLRWVESPMHFNGNSPCVSTLDYCKTNLDVAPGVEPVELVDEFEHGSLDLVVSARPVVVPGSANRVNLVEKDQTRLLCSRHFEQFAHHSCTLAHVLKS